MLTTETIIDRLRSRSTYLAEEYGVERIGLFGSFAKGTAVESSDVDLVVELRHPLGFKFVDLAEYLEHLLERKVDVLTPVGLRASVSRASPATSTRASSMSERGERELLADILESARRTSLYIAGMDYSEFMADLKTQDAVIRALEVVGEATKRLTPAFRAQHPEIPWKNMAGARDKLIHDYFGVNFDVVWQIVTQELPAVARQVGQILDREDQ